MTLVRNVKTPAIAGVFALVVALFLFPRDRPGGLAGISASPPKCVTLLLPVIHQGSSAGASFGARGVGMAVITQAWVPSG